MIEKFSTSASTNAGATSSIVNPSFASDWAKAVNVSPTGSNTYVSRDSAIVCG